MNNRKWVENVIIGIIALNIFVLAFVFLIPRAQLIVDQWGESVETLMETSGAKDTPNQYSKTYRVANSIQKIVGNDSIVIMPPDSRKFVSNRSVLIQRLYPRKIYFSGEDGFVDLAFSLADKDMEIYVVFHEHWGKNFCKKHAIQSLSNPDFGICRIGKGNPTHLLNSL